MENFTYTTVRMFRFKGFLRKYIALSIMGLSKLHFPKPANANVNKLLGTGSGLGFSRVPNLGQYAHLGVWKDGSAERSFSQSNFLIKILKYISYETQTFVLKPFQSRGVWDGKNPYPAIASEAEVPGKVVILTRAKVKFLHLHHFWKHVNPSNHRLSLSKGRIFSAGLGEWPFSHPITFSVWENLNFAKDFAYKHPEHAEAIKGAREGGWFKEDLFVRYALMEEIIE